jgi:hypothetical protein
MPVNPILRHLIFYADRRPPLPFDIIDEDIGNRPGRDSLLCHVGSSPSLTTNIHFTLYHASCPPSRHGLADHFPSIAERADIVYMRSRAFRNSIDAAITKRALSLFDVRIVSCKEDFGIGPVADAMETVSDAFNELQVRQNGEDIRQKLRHKALNGGTIARAKLGYLNTRAEYEGKLFNSIGLDDRRAPLVHQAFELYATGERHRNSKQTPGQGLDVCCEPHVRTR